jgi:hypothetical protein
MACSFGLARKADETSDTAALLCWALLQRYILPGVIGPCPESSASWITGAVVVAAPRPSASQSGKRATARVELKAAGLQWSEIKEMTTRLMAGRGTSMLGA